MEAWSEFGMVEVRLVAQGLSSMKLALEEGSVAVVFRLGERPQRGFG